MPDTVPGKILTLHAPHGLLCATGAKPWETRSWPTRYRGLLVIHQGLAFTAEARALCRTEPFRSAILAAGLRAPGEQPLGAILAVVRVVDCVPTETLRGTLPVPAATFGDFGPGRYAWKLELVTRVDPPVPHLGGQGLRDYAIPMAWVGSAREQFRTALRQQERGLETLVAGSSREETPLGGLFDGTGG